MSNYGIQEFACALDEGPEVDLIDLAEFASLTRNRMPTETIIRRRRGNVREWWVAVEIDAWWVCVSLVVGPRGGLQERILILDPAQPILIDRLVFAGVERLNPNVFPLDDMRRQIKVDDEDPGDVCSREIEDFLQRVQEGDKRLLSRIRSYRNANSSFSGSIGTVSAGAPTLGKRR